MVPNLNNYYSKVLYAYHHYPKREAKYGPAFLKIIASMDPRFNQRFADITPLEGHIPAKYSICMTVKIILKPLKCIICTSPP